jgi:CRISPR-associated protein Csm5
MTAQFEMVEALVVPLTPIHVGGGEEAVLRPETYRLAEDALELFAPARVLADLPEGPRRQLVADLARDPLGTMDRVRKAVRDHHVLERMAAAPESLQALRQALRPAAEKGQQRSGEVNAFQRAGDGPLIPGSSLKGALRTAWLAREAAGLAPAAIWPGRFGNDGETEAVKGRAHDALVERAFSLPRGTDATDVDPFRDVTVSDAPLRANATRIDPVKSWKRIGGSFGFPEKSPQMHWERTLAVIDGGEPPLIRVSLGVRTGAVRRRRRDRAPARPPESVAALLAALEAHHAPLWRREAEETFFAGPAGERLRAALGFFAALRRDGPDPDAALLRIGRGGHAESKSVARFRTVHRPQAAKAGGRAFAAEGSTRHVVSLAGRPAPFGWALLVRADRWRPPARWLDEPGASASAARDAARAAPSRWLFREGQRVTVGGEPARVVSNVGPEDREAMLDFGDGPEPVKVSEIDP